MRLQTPVFIALAFVLGLAGPVLAQDHEGAKVRYQNGILYLEVEGTPYEMGFQHGTALKNEIKKSVADYQTNVRAAFGDENAAKIINWVLNDAQFPADIKKHLPHVWEEIRGIAAGAGVDVEEVLLLQMFEEVYEAGPLRIGINAPEQIGHGCTAFIAKGSDKHYAGQNMDYSGNLHEKQLIIRYKYPDHEILSYTFVGTVGTLGVNSHGVSIFITTLPQGSKREKDGIGATFLSRAVLDARSVDEAVARLKKLPRFGGLTYTISDFDKAVTVEASANEWAVHEMSDKKPVIVFTNHILTLKERHDMPGLYENGEALPDAPHVTLARRAVALQKLSTAVSSGSLNPDTLKTLLIETPNNIYTKLFMTLQSAFVEYDGKKATFYVSAGYDPQRGWNTFSFEK